MTASGDQHTTVWDVLRSFVLRPGDSILRQWNWKAAVFASLLRGLIFFFSTLKAGWRAASVALLVEFVYRGITSGFWGAMTQAFRRARPERLATTCALVVIPLISHALELAVHVATRGTTRLWAGMASSIFFTVIVTSFNLYAMRRGAMLVGEDAQPFGSDMSKMPGLIAGFVLAGLRLVIARLLPERRPMQ